MSTSITRLLHTFLLAALMLPLFTFAQVSPVGQELPAFLKDIKTEADFDKLTPAQKAEAEEYMKNLSDNFVMVADVSIYDAKITSENNGVIGLSFDLANGEGVQTGVKYSVSLIRKTDAGEFLADIYVYPEVLTLKSQSTLKKEITYTAPSGLSGEYTVLIKSSTESGLLLGLSSPGTIVLAPALKGVEILTDTCDLHVEGEAGNPSYTLVQGVDITASEKLLLTCDVKNFGPIPVTVTPVYETRVQTMYGKVAPHEGGSMEALTLGGDETKSVTLTLPKVATPQAFDVRVALENTDTTSNAVIAHYVLVGSSATIRNVILDKESYSAGDTAKVSFIWTPAADGFPDSRHGANSPSATTLAVTIQDGTTPCIAPQTVTLSGEMRQELSLPITASCAHPEFGFTITDASGTTLDSATLTTIEKSDPTMLVEGGDTGMSNTTKLIIILTTLSALVLLLALVKIHAKLHPNTVLKSLVFAVLIAGSLMGGAGRVEAVSIIGFSDMKVIDVNKRIFTPNENIIFNYSAFTGNLCANVNGIQQFIFGYLNGNDFTIANGWQAQNVVLFGQSSYPAPANPGNYRIYFHDWFGSTYAQLLFIGIDMSFIDITVVPACAPTSGQACSPRNACGAVANGTVQCNGSCNVAAPALPANQGQSCQSAPNVCGMVSNAGTWNCGVCSSVKPADALCLPAQPAAFNAVPGACGTNKIDFNWPAVPGATGYDGQIDGGAWFDLGNILSTTHNNLQPGSSHTYNIRAKNASGFGPSRASNPSPVIAPAVCVAVPAQPAAVNAGPGACGTNKIDLNWSAVAGATGYDIQIDGGNWNNINNVTMYTHNNLQPGSSHTYSIRARNASGFGPSRASNPSPVVAPAVCPPGVPPQPAAVNAGPGACGTNKIDLNWSAVPGATGYDIQIDGGNWNNINNVTMYTHNNLQPGSQHTYNVRAWNGVGAGQGRASNPTPVNAPAVCVAVPPQPAAFNAGPGACGTNKIDLNWSAVPGATGYDIQIDGGIWTNLGNTTVYTHNNLQPGSQHTYNVRAWNASGFGPSRASNPSPVIAPAVCPPGVPPQPAAVNAGTWSKQDVQQYDIQIDGGIWTNLGSSATRIATWRITQIKSLKPITSYCTSGVSTWCPPTTRSR
jgi:hypothetical protein